MSRNTNSYPIVGSVNGTNGGGVGEEGAMDGEPVAGDSGMNP